MSLAHAPRPLHEIPVSLHAIDLAVRALRSKLNELNYCPHVSRQVCLFAHANHHLGGLIEMGVEPEDEGAIEDAFASGWPEVDMRSVLWRDPTTWGADVVPSIQESLEYALMAGEFDVHGAPLNPPPDLEPDRDWAEWSVWSADMELRNPWIDYETAELDEVGISRR